MTGDDRNAVGDGMVIVSILTVSRVVDTSIYAPLVNLDVRSCRATR